MRKDFPAEIYSVLFFLLLCIGGCYLPSGGGTIHTPSKKIICDKPWVITLGFYVWPEDPKEKYGKLAERWKDVTIHIRDFSNDNFLAVPMVIESVNPEIGEMRMKADMKLIPCDSGVEYVEYYIEDTFGYHYSRTEIFKVPVSRD